MSTETGPRGPIVTATGAIASNPLPAGGPRVPLPTDKELVLKVVPMPADCNANGDIFGGWVMAQVDIAGALPAATLTPRCPPVSTPLTHEESYLYSFPQR